jgi:serine/threonine protein phosphatase PrpC
MSRADSARAVGASVCGVSHTRDGLPNQDALAISHAAAHERRCVVAAVADGHGGPRHFRSATGARFAVDAATDTLRGFAAEWEAASPEKQQQLASTTLPEAIVADWSARVRRHLEAQPIQDAEWATLESHAGVAGREHVEAEPAFAYGATLIAALVTSRHILLLQVGDGDAMLVAPDGKAWHPIPKDARLTGEFTTSICRSNAEQDFRHAIVTADGTASLLMLATDGYSNSFRTDADFLQVGTDVLQMVRQDGVRGVEQQLPRILADASANGSGDDITVALIYLGEPEPRVAGGRVSAHSTLRASEVRAELVSLRNQVQRFRTALAAVAVIAVVSLGWTFRAQLAALAESVGHGTPKTAPHEFTPGDGKPGDPKPGPPKFAPPKSGGAQPGETKSGEAKPGETKPGEPKPGETKPRHVKPADEKPHEAKPGEVKPREAKPREAKPGEVSDGGSKAPA